MPYKFDASDSVATASCSGRSKQPRFVFLPLAHLTLSTTVPLVTTAGTPFGSHTPTDGAFGRSCHEIFQNVQIGHCRPTLGCFLQLSWGGL